jgi:hypothetical protein
MMMAPLFLWGFLIYPRGQKWVHNKALPEKKIHLIWRNDIVNKGIYKEPWTRDTPMAAV